MAAQHGRAPETAITFKGQMILTEVIPGSWIWSASTGSPVIRKSTPNNPQVVQPVLPAMRATNVFKVSSVTFWLTRTWSEVGACGARAVAVAVSGIFRLLLSDEKLCCFST